MADLELGDIQGIILSGYRHLPNSAYLFLHLDDEAGGRSWLARLVDQVTSADWVSEDGRKVKPDVGVNVAFSASGLKTLGLKEPSQIEDDGTPI